MRTDSSTIWTTIENAADGDASARDQFARTYLPAVSAYLGARWSGSNLSPRIDDAAQDVFVECFKDQGSLKRVSREETESFRGYLYGITRNVARRYEQSAKGFENAPPTPLSKVDPPADETSLSQVFDRAWARSMMRQAGQRHRELAAAAGDRAVRRVELLELRFRKGWPIRHIADHWQQDATLVHREYAKAREEFRQALTEVIRLHHTGSEVDIQAEAKLILSLLS